MSDNGKSTFLALNTIKMHNDKLKQIAMDIIDGKIFCDRMIPQSDKTSLMMIFLPIALGAFKNPEDAKDIGMIYEYNSQAGPRSINGYPCFTSFQIIKQEDMEKFFEYYEAYKKLKEDFQSK